MRHPVTRYFLLAFGGTWLLQLPMLLGLNGLGLFPYRVPMPLYIGLFLLSSFVPAGAAIWLTGRLEGAEGRRLFFRRFGQWRVGWLPIAIAVAGYPVLYLVTYRIAAGRSPLPLIAGHWSALVTVYLPALLVFPALITWGEEPGWRGFALTRLQREINPVAAALLVGAMHALWHLPIYILVDGPPAIGPFDLGHFLYNSMNIVVITVLWAWIFNSARQSILIATMVHASSNATGALMKTWLGALPPTMTNTMLVFYLALAALAIVATRGRLRYPPG